MEPDLPPLVVGLGGTPRPGSSSELAARRVLAEAGRLGARIEMLGGADLVLPIFVPGDMQRTPAALRLIELLRRADGIVIASPGYHGSLSGLIKNALDYTEDMRDDAACYLDGRAVGTIACAAGWQATGSTLAALRSIVHALRGWPTPIGVAVNTSAPVFGTDGACLDPNVDDALREMGRQIVDFAMCRKAARLCAR